MQPLKEQITALLEALELNFEFDEENNLFRLNFETENAPVHVCISYDDERKLIINRSWISINLPKVRIAAILYAINKLHDEWCTPAYLYLDEDDNELSSRCMIDVPEAGVDQEVFACFVDSTVGVLDKNFKDIMAVAYGTEFGNLGGTSEPKEVN